MYKRKKKKPKSHWAIRGSYVWASESIPLDSCSLLSITDLPESQQVSLYLPILELHRWEAGAPMIFPCRWHLEEISSWVSVLTNEVKLCDKLCSFFSPKPREWMMQAWILFITADVQLLSECTRSSDEKLWNRTRWDICSGATTKHFLVSWKGKELLRVGTQKSSWVNLLPMDETSRASKTQLSLGQLSSKKSEGFKPRCREAQALLSTQKLKWERNLMHATHAETLCLECHPHRPPMNVRKRPYVCPVRRGTS